MRTTEDRASGELREGYADVGDVRLHYVEAGEGPLVVLLHGFPEFWYGWREQIGPLAAAGFRVVAPDMRGYNLSSKPDGVARLRHRPAGRRHRRPDPRARRRVRDAGRARLGRVGRLGHRDGLPRGGGPAGHLERGPPAQAVAGTAPPRAAPQVLVLLLLRPPRPARNGRARRPLALLPALPARRLPGLHPRGDGPLPSGVVAAGRGHRDDQLLPSSVRTPPKQAEAAIRPIKAPTLVIWGQADRYLGQELAEPDDDDVPGLDRVERLPDASHWVHSRRGRTRHPPAHRLFRPRSGQIERVKIMNTTHWRRAPLAACCAALAALALAAAGATAATAGTRAVASGSGGAPIATTGDGAVRGVAAGSINEFLGIPYAAPPTGTCGGAHRSRRPSGRGSATPPSSGRAARSRRRTTRPSRPAPSARTACTSTCTRPALTPSR